MRKAFGLALAMLLALSPAAFAQIAGGNIYGTATDESGAVLPGVNVTLSSEIGTRNTVTGEQGNFRFLSLPRGEYSLSLSLGGFATVTRNVRVTTGENVELSFTMKVSGVEETLLVTAETPLVDTKRRGTSTTMTNEELSQVPNARDPWAVIRAVPGVVVDRVNIAGNENGQQASYGGKGTSRTDSMWNLDGLVITDMSATGASPTYFDFEAFEEIAVTTGGNDLATQSGGIGINLTTKRGTNSFHGSARFMMSHRDLSFSNLPSSMSNDPRLENADGSRRDKADHIAQITDYGFDLGGPIIKDKLWFYGTYGKQDIRVTRLRGTPDKTLLPAYNAKLNFQASANTMISAFWFNGNKQKFGRSIGFPGESDTFLWNQANLYQDGGIPGGLWKLQVDHTFSPNFFMSAKGAYYDTGFGLTPRGGLDNPDAWTIDFFRGESIGSFAQYGAVRPQKNVTVDGNYFFDGLGGQNELKFGFSWRDYKTISGYRLGGQGIYGYLYDATSGDVEVGRSSRSKEYSGLYLSAYVGDVLSLDRWTFNFGVRWDSQKAKNNAAEVAANATFPELLPALQFPGDPDWAIDWNFISPRVGFSYALNDSRTSVLRGSYAMYGGQLSFGDVDSTNPIGWGALAYAWNDTNGDRFVQTNEIDFQGGTIPVGDTLATYTYGVNLADPSSAVSPNRHDEDYSPQIDHEVVLGIDHELGASLAVGAAYTFRTNSDFGIFQRIGGECPVNANRGNCPVISAEQYVENASDTANGFSATSFAPPSDLVAAGGSARLTTNAPGYSRTFNGLEFTLTKRLTDRWMSRIAVSYNNWKENWDGRPYSITADYGNPTHTETDPTNDGGLVSLYSGGSGAGNFYTSQNWTVYANGLWQAPGGFDLSGALTAVQGVVYPVSLQLSLGADGTEPALARAIDDERLDTVVNFDLRLAKTLRLGEGAGITFSAEWFNVFNSGTVLARYRYATGSAFTDTAGGAEPGVGRIETLLAPSIFRFGARLTF